MTPLAVLRKQRFLTQTELAAAAGIRYMTVLCAETRQSTPRMGTIHAICRVLGLKPEDVDEFRRALDLPQLATAKAVVSFGTQLRRWREALAVTQVELARDSGVSKSTICLAELGQQTLRPPTMRKLATALGVEPRDLLTGEPPSNAGRRCAGCGQLMEYAPSRRYHSSACRQRDHYHRFGDPRRRRGSHSAVDRPGTAE